MESYQTLLNWEGKMEPSSPSSPLSQATEEECYFFDEDFAIENIFEDVMFDIDPADIKPAAIELLYEIVEDANIEIDDEQWLEEKIKIPPLEEYVPLPAGPVAVQQQKVQSGDELMIELEYMYELTHLTPPQTPPQEQQQHQYQLPTTVTANPGYIIYSPAVDHQYQVPTAWNESLRNFANSVTELPSDIARELEVVDELVRSRSKDLPDWTDEDDDDNSCSASSETGSISSSSPRSDSSYCGSAYSKDQDDDWSPKNGPKSSSLSGVTKRRVRGRGSEDKKSRKKEQNKNAATRYRQKKKAEIEEILEEERLLQEVNDKLQSKSNDIRREINYLKSLMRELYKAKGLI